MKYLLLATTLLALPLVARAQPVDGFYVGAGAGVNFMQPEKREFNEDITELTPPGSRLVIPPAHYGEHYRNNFDVGAVGVASVGYGLGNGLRIEAEGDYRYNENRYVSGQREQKFGGMANALFDLDIGSPYVFPYIGAGVGYMWTDRTYLNVQVGSLAYQGIAGAAFPIPGVAGLSATLEYRFLGLGTAKNSDTVSSGSITIHTANKYNDDYNHSILVGVRYAFNTPEPPPPPPVIAPVPAPAPARTYLVFFDWDRADLTDRARQIVAEAAQASTRVQTTRIEVQGNADRSGTPAYNQGLSLRRAQTVAAELVRLGVPRTAIDIQAFGDTRPLVPTAPGVR